MDETPEQRHERLASTSRDVLAYLTALAGDLEDVADDVMDEHRDGPDGGTAFTVLLSLEALHAYHLLAEATGQSVQSILAERGAFLSTL